MTVKNAFGGILLVITFQASLHAQVAGDTSATQERDMISQSTTEQNVKLTVECMPTFWSGAENYVTITVRNIGHQPVQYYRIAPQSLGVGFEVTRQGKPVSTTAIGSQRLVPNPFASAREPVQIDSGKELRVVVNVTRYYDLSIPEDTYQIVATWWGMADGNEDAIRVRTKPLDFDVELKAGESESKAGAK